MALRPLFDGAVPKANAAELAAGANRLENADTPPYDAIVAASIQAIGNGPT